MPPKPNPQKPTQGGTGGSATVQRKDTEPKLCLSMRQHKSKPSFFHPPNSFIMNGFSNFQFFKMRMSLRLVTVASAIFLVVATLIFSACEKNKLAESEQEAAPSEMALTLSSEGAEYFFIDNQSVPQSQFSWDVDTVWYHIVVGEQENPNSLNLYYYAYNSKSLYDQKVRSEIGPKHDVHESIIAHLSAYAVSSGAVDSLELTGTVPQSYLDYEAAYLAANLPKDSLVKATDRGLSCILYKISSCRNAFVPTIPLFGTPFFIFNNNKADSMWPLFLGGHHKAFDKSFYRKRMFSVIVGAKWF